MDLCEDSGGENMATIEDVPPIAEATVPQATDCVVPMTPEYFRENEDLQSPLTLSVVRNQLKLTCIDSERNANGSVDNGNCDSPRTPKDGVFNPFAPGPDNMAQAPQSYKYLEEFRNTVSRQLNFHPSFDAVQHQNPFLNAESLSDEDMIEAVYENLLQVIVSNQTEGVLAQISNVEYDSDDCKTPPSPLPFTGIADTCPGAPMKPAGRPRSIQVGLCGLRKKLEF